MSTSYSNPQGTGNRHIFIVASMSAGLQNGTFGAPGAGATIDGDKTAKNWWFNTAAAAGTWIKWNLFAPVVIDEIKFYQELTTSHGIWQAQGSNDGTNWTNIGSSFTLGGSATQTITALSGNTTAYQYYRLLGVSGSTSNAPFVYEFEFKVSNPATDPIIVDATVTKCLVRIVSVRASGAANDGYADSVSLTVGGSEQITNGGAEVTTGWDQTVMRFGSTGIASAVGSWVFYGGGNFVSELTQTVDLSAVGIAGQNITCSALLGGFSTDNDAASVSYCFQDASSVAIGGAILLPVYAAERSNVTSLISRSISFAGANLSPLLTLQSVAANTVAVGPLVNTPTQYGATIGIQFGRRSSSALTECMTLRIEGSSFPSGDGYWFSLEEFETLTLAVTSQAVNGTCLSGQNVIPMSSTTGMTLGSIVYIDNPAMVFSEWGRIKAITTNTSITLEDNLVNVQTGSTVYPGAELFYASIDLTAIGRIRIVADGRTTGQPVAAQAYILLAP